MNLSFAGCGFHGMYHIGVISCLQRHGKTIMKDVSGYGGASAGSLVAALLATSTPLEQGLKFTTELATKVRKYFLGALNPSFDLMQHLDDGLKRFLPQDAHKRASGKLYVSVSRFPQCENSIVSQFDSRDDLIQVNNVTDPVKFFIYVILIHF
jgi:predicted acylesterase/phospholipase RssA